MQDVAFANESITRLTSADLQAEGVYRTVLVTDAVESTRITAKFGPAATLRINEDLERFVQVGIELGGIPARDRGDGYMFIFREPVSAVRAAIEMQRLATRSNGGSEIRLQHRMGIHVGDVMIVHKLSNSDILTEDSPPHKFTGETVTIAARLEEVCPPGEICLSRDVWRMVKGIVNVGFVDMDQGLLKGLSMPVRCYCTHLDPFAGPLRNRNVDVIRAKHLQEDSLKRKLEREIMSRIVRSGVAVLALAALVAVMAIAAPQFYPQIFSKLNFFDKKRPVVSVEASPMVIERSPGPGPGPSPTPPKRITPPKIEIDSAELDSVLAQAVSSLRFEDATGYIRSRGLAGTSVGKRRLKQAVGLQDMKRWLESSFRKSAVEPVNLQTSGLPYAALIGWCPKGFVATDLSNGRVEVPLSELGSDGLETIIGSVRDVYPNPKVESWLEAYRDWASTTEGP